MEKTLEQKAEEFKKICIEKTKKEARIYLQSLPEEEVRIISEHKDYQHYYKSALMVC